MRRKIILLPLLLLLVVAALLATGWYLLGNEAFLKKQLKSWVFDQTGRTIEVTGLLRFHPGSISTIHAQGVRLSNASWASEPSMLELGQLVLAVDTMSLFGERPNITQLAVSDCQLRIAENDEGLSNWDMFGNGKTKPEEIAVKKKHLFVDLLNISNCHITDENPARDEPENITVDEVSLKELNDGNFTGQGSGSINDLPMRLKGTFGPVESLWQGGPFHHDVNMTIGKNSLQSKGSFEQILTGSGANVEMNLSGPEITRVLDFFALPDVSSGAFNLNLSLDTKSSLTQLKLDGDLGSFDIAATGELDHIVRPMEGNVVVTASGPDLKALGEVFDIEGLVATRFDIKATATIEKGEIKISPAVLETSQDSLEFSGEVGALPEMKNSNIIIDIKSDELGRWAGLWKKTESKLGYLNAIVRAQTDAKGLLSVQSDIKQKVGELNIKGTLGTMPEPLQPQLAFDFRTDDFSQMGALLSLEKFPAVPLNASGNFQLLDSSFNFTPVKVDVAGSKLSYSGLISREKPYVGANAKLNLDIKDAQSFGALFGVKDLPNEPIKANASLSPAGSGVAFLIKDGNLGDIRLGLSGEIPNVSEPALFSADVDIKLPSARLLGVFVPDQELPDLPLVLKGGFAHSHQQLRFSAFHLEMGDAEADIDGVLGLGELVDESRLTLSGTVPDIDQLITVPRLQSLPRDLRFSGTWSESGKKHELEQFKIQLGQITMQLTGSVDNPADPQNIDMDLTLAVPDASRLNAPLELDLPEKPLNLETHFKGSLHEFVLSGLEGSLGESKVKADLTITTGPDGKMDGVIESEFLDFRRWIEKRQKKDPVSGSPAKPAAEERVFPDELVTTVGDSMLDLELDIKVKLADLGNTKIKDIHIGVHMSDHRLTFDPVILSDLEGSNATGRFNLDALSGIPKMDIDVSGKNIRLGLAAAKGQDPSTYPPAEIFVKLEGTGHTWHELASSINGNVRIYQGAGLFASSGLDFFYSDFITNLFGALSLTSKQNEFTKLDCSVIAANFVDGDVTVNPIVFQTERVTVLSAGTVDLETEQIDLTFNTKPRTGLGLSAGAVINPFIKVGGTLMHPAVQFDAAGAVIGGGTAVATVGLSLLAKSFSDRFLSTKDPCGDARNKLEKEDSKAG